MKKFVFLFILLLISTLTWGQLSGVQTIPGSFSTVGAAVTALNTQGVGPGGVIFNVAAGHTEVVPAGGILLTATGTAANTIVFQKSGVGANPILSRTDAGTLATSAQGGQGDAVVIIEGSDFVTFDGIDINTTNEGIEYGYYIRKASVTDGSKNITIRNAVIDMTRGTSQFVTAIYSSNNSAASLVSTATGITVTSEDGRNENLNFSGLTITDVFIGIYVRGFNHTTAPHNFFDQNVVIGTATMPNNITNFGGNNTGTSYGVYTIYVNNLNVSHNQIVNQPGVGAGFTGVGYGIFTSLAASANTTITNNTVTVLSSATTQGLHAINNSSGSTAANNTITISNNTVTNSSYTTATTAVFNGILNSGSAAFIVMNGNTVSNSVLAGTGAMTLLDAGGAAASVVTMSNNTVNNNQKTGASGSLFSSRSAGATTYFNNNIFNNGFTAASGTSSAIVYGYFNAGSPLFEEIYNNNIHTLFVAGTNTATASILNGIHTNTVAGATKLIYGNNVHGLSALSGTANGISQAVGTNVRIYANNIHNISNNDATTTVGRVNGILINSGTTYVYNNFISNLRAPLGNNNDVVRGISSTSATALSEVGIYYNTIFLNATSTGTNFGTSGIFHTTSATATTATLDMRNNIVVNISTPNGTGQTVAYRRSSNVLTNYSNISNNNNFFAGTPGPANLLFFDNTSGDQTLAAFKTRVSPAESGTFTENTPFINSTVAPFNLRINPTITTQSESAAQIINLPFVINTDFDNNPRFSNTLYTGTGTAPDIGANEGNFTGIDMTPPSISYSLLLNNIITTTIPMNNVSITDGTGVNYTPGFAPRIYFKRSTDNNAFVGNTSADNGWKFVETTSSSSPVNFAINHALLFGGSVSVGDTIQYFVVAQDIAPIGANVGINVGTFNSIPSSVNLVATNFPVTGALNFYTIVNPLSGQYLVGSGGVFPNLTGVGGAFEAINQRVMSGNAELLISSDIIEPGTVSLNVITEVGAGGYTLTIRPADPTMKIISGAPTATNGLFRLRGADRVIFDGSFSGSGRFLTFANDASTTANTAVFQVISLGIGAGSSDISIRNSIIIGNSSSTTTTFGIHVGGASISTTGTGANNNNLTIENNIIERAYFGIYARGVAGAGLLSGLIIRNNIIGSNDVNNYILFRGVDIQSAIAPIVERNEIFNLRLATSVSNAGIDLGANVTNAIVSRNRIWGIHSTSTAGYGAYGINISATSTENITISNNVIYDLITSNYSLTSTTFNAFGIRIIGGTNHNVFYNSVNLFGNVVGGTAAGMSASFIVTSNAATGLDVKNNIFANSTNFAVTGAKAYAAYVVSGTVFAAINRNNYFSSGTYALFGFYGADRLDLAAWRTSSTQDLNSFSINPIFTSNTDLTINSGLAPIQLESAAAVIPGITVDFNGTTRPAPGALNGGGTAPDIGAYEFDGVPAVSLHHISSTTTQTNTGLIGANSINSQIIGIEIVVGGQVDVLTSSQFNFSTNGTTALTDLVNAKLWHTGTSATFATTTQVGSTVTDFTGGLFSVAGTTNLVAGTNYFWLTYDISPNAVNNNFVDAECLSIVLSSGTVTPTVTAPVGNRRIVGTFSGVRTVGTNGDFNSLAEAFNIINSTGLNGNLILNIISNITETTVPTLNQWTEVPASSNYHILIQPQGGNWTISGNLTSIIRLNGADRVMIDGLNTAGNALTIQNNSTATNTAAIWISSLGAGLGSNGISIRNSRIIGGSNTVASAFGVHIGGTSISTSGTGADNKAILFENNIVERAHIGFYARGVLTTGRVDSLRIANNIFGSLVDTNSIGNIGISLQHASQVEIANNTIFNLKVGSNPMGIFLGTDFTLAQISRNLIYDIIFTGTTGFGGKGMRINTGNANSNMLIVNNVIHSIGGDGWSSLASDAIVGIQVLGTTGGISFYFNSINLSGNSNRAATATQSAAIYFPSTAANIDLRNNTFTNSIVNTLNAGSKAYAIANAGTNTAFSTINYNNYFAAGTQAVLGLMGTTDITSISAWRTASSQDVNSVSVTPMFTSSFNLKPLPGSPLFNAGLPLATINTDILGINRGTVSTSIGAYEAISATINPNSFVFDIGFPTNAVTNITWNDATSIVSIMNTTNSTLLLPNQFSVTGNILTINSSYLSSILTTTPSSAVLSIRFNAGVETIFTITSIHTISAVINPTSANYIVNEPASISTNITWNSAASITSIVDNQTVPYTLTAADFSVVGNVLTFNQSYLATSLPTAGLTRNLTVNFNVGNPAVFVVNSTTTVGVNDNIIEHSVYPNPSNGQFIITTNENLNMIIYDLKGRVIYTVKLISGTNSINVKGQPSGIYSIKIFNDTKSENFKIIIE